MDCWEVVGVIQGTANRIGSYSAPMGCSCHGRGNCLPEDDPRGCACLLVVSAEHGSEWQRALLIAACGLQMDDEMVRVAISLCQLMQATFLWVWCCSGQEFMGFFAPRAQAGFQDITWSMTSSAALIIDDVLLIKEPKRLLRSDARCPKDFTLVPFLKSKMLTWDATITDRLPQTCQY